MSPAHEQPTYQKYDTRLPTLGVLPARGRGADSPDPVAYATAGMGAATWVPGTSAHSWQAVAAGGMSIGQKGMMVAAKTLSLTAMDIFKDPSVTGKALDELNKRRGDDFSYEALVGDRKPPLDYRK